MCLCPLGGYETPPPPPPVYPGTILMIRPNALVCMVSMGIQCPSAQSRRGCEIQIQKTKKKSLSRKVTLCVVPDRIEYECLAEKHFYFVICPILCRQGLQEHDDALRGGRVLTQHGREREIVNVMHLKVHLTELVAPSHKKCRADIQVKLRKGICAFCLPYISRTVNMATMC